MDTISQFIRAHHTVLVIIAILLVPSLITWLLLFLHCKHVDKFRAQIKEGQPVCFFIDEDRVIGVAVIVSDNGVTINSVYGQYVRNISEIYPV